SAFEPATQWILVAADGSTRLAGSPGVSIEPGSGSTFTYVDFGRSVANRLILATSNRATAGGNNDISGTPCGGGTDTGEPTFVTRRARDAGVPGRECSAAQACQVRSSQRHRPTQAQRRLPRAHRFVRDGRPTTDQAAVEWAGPAVGPKDAKLRAKRACLA